MRVLIFLLVAIVACGGKKGGGDRPPFTPKPTNKQGPALTGSNCSSSVSADGSVVTKCLVTVCVPEGGGVWRTVTDDVNKIFEQYFDSPGAHRGACGNQDLETFRPVIEAIEGDVGEMRIIGGKE